MTAPDSIPDIASNLAEVQRRVLKAASDAGRASSAVTLVAVGKTFGPERIEPALVAGQRVFGENRVQEAADKWPPLRSAYSDLRLHLIGPLQSNKVKRAVELFDVIETVDRPKIAKALAAALGERARQVSCFLQVNTGAEPQKAGVLPEAADDFIGFCRDDLALPVRGLMCIPPLDEEPSLHFALLAEIARRNGLDGLSMGMSADFDVAIAFGATHVRVGTAIFGARAPRAASTAQA